MHLCIPVLKDLPKSSVFKFENAKLLSRVPHLILHHLRGNAQDIIHLRLLIRLIIVRHLLLLLHLRIHKVVLSQIRLETSDGMFTNS